MCKLIQSRRRLLFRRNIKPCNIFNQVEHNILTQLINQTQQPNLKLNMRLFHIFDNIKQYFEQDDNTTIKHIISVQKIKIHHITDLETTKRIRQALLFIEFEFIEKLHITTMFCRIEHKV